MKPLIAILLTAWLAGALAAQEAQKPPSQDQQSKQEAPAQPAPPSPAKATPSDAKSQPKQSEAPQQTAPGEGESPQTRVYKIAKDSTAPIPIYKPIPSYSDEARKAKFQGTVVLWIVVDAQGNVTNVRVVKPLGLGLDEKAVQTVKTWKFKPATRNGIPVAVALSVEVSFRLF